jgi:rhodanese-related sulfurtransferase
MKRLHAALASTLLFLTACAADVARVAPAEAAQLVADGAILIDVRELAEWQESGVAAPALLLPMSDFNGAQADWKPVLAAAKEKDQTLVLYCRSGNRSGRVAAALAEQGYKVVNAGGFKDWQAAGLPVRKVE